MKSTLQRLTRDNSPGNEGETEYYILGGETVARSTAKRLREEGRTVGVVDETHDDEDIPGEQGNPEDVRLLAEAGVPDASTVVVATGEDSRNLLIAQLVQVHFDVRDIFVLVNDPDRRELVAAAGHEPLCVTSIIATGLADTLG